MYDSDDDDCAFYLHESCFESWTDPTSPSTNQSAELGAVLGAIQRACLCGDWSIVICTESQYAINSLTIWPDFWRANAEDGWTWRNQHGNPVADQQLIEEILALIDNREVGATISAHTYCCLNRLRSDSGMSLTLVKSVLKI